MGCGLCCFVKQACFVKGSTAGSDPKNPAGSSPFALPEVTSKTNPTDLQTVLLGFGGLFCLWATPGCAWDLLLVLHVGSHSWLGSGNHNEVLGIKPWSAVCHVPYPLSDSSGPCMKVFT